MNNRTVAAYAAELAAATPTPGGGSAAATVASLAAALAEMVVRFTVGRPAFTQGEPELAGSRERMGDLRTRFLDLAAADEAAYGAYRAALALPKDDAAAKLRRRAALDAALRRAADVPLQVAEGCEELLSELRPILRRGNPHVLSDGVAAALFAEAALRAAVTNVRVNARLMRAPETAAAYRRRAEEIETRGRSLAADLITLAAAR